MLAQLVRKVFGGKAAAPVLPALPAVVDLTPAAGIRLIVPAVEEGYAALVNSDQGLVIINHYDLAVGWQLRTVYAYDVAQMRVFEALVRACAADPVVLDLGANIGIASLVLARAAGPRGLVHAFEPQRVIFNMLAGNMALNGIANVHCHWQAAGSRAGTARLPCLNYRSDASFGSVELNREQQSDAAQQAQGGAFEDVPMDSIDAMQLPRVDLIKIDVEGMEADVLAGALQTLRAHRPLLHVEYIKSDQQALGRLLAAEGYALYLCDGNFVCIPPGRELPAALAGELPPWSPDQQATEAPDSGAGMLQNAARKGPSAPPQILNLENRREVRVILPHIAGSDAALLNAPQGFFIFDRRDPGIAWRERHFDAAEPARLALLARLVQAAPPDPVILDIGAGIGAAAITLARSAGPGALVHAFEAQREVFHMLAGNAALNSADNLRCQHRSFVPDDDAGSGPAQSVDALALPRVDMIKISVAGRPAEVLRGAGATLRAQRPLIAIEHIGGDRQAIAQILGAAGYRLFDSPGTLVGIPAGHPRADALAQGLTPAGAPA